MALMRLDGDEKGLVSNETPSGIQEMGAVNEYGLYSLILGSRKPEAKRIGDEMNVSLIHTRETQPT